MPLSFLPSALLAGQSHMAMRLVLPPPLRGRVGVGGREIVARTCVTRRPPPPTPPRKGEGRRTVAPPCAIALLLWGGSHWSWQRSVAATQPAPPLLLRRGGGSRPIEPARRGPPLQNLSRPLRAD